MSAIVSETETESIATFDGNLPRPLRGIVPPMVTPMTARDTLDCAGLERLIEHMVAGGIHGLFILGTTGEGPSLSYRLRRELIQRTCRQIAGRIPVLVGVTDTAFVESVDLANYAAEAGATAAVFSAPYYFPAGQPELLEYVTHLVKEIPLPVFLYNMPSLTKTTFGLELLAEAVQMPEIAGLKDSSGDINYFRQAVAVAKARPDFAVLMGPEEILTEAITAGGHGGVCGGANLRPQILVGLYEALAAGDTARAAELQADVIRQSDLLYHIGRHSSAIIKGIKCALSCLGICDDWLAEPFNRFNPPERERVERVLRELGLGG